MTEAEKPGPAELKQWSQELSLGALTCRDLHHTWRYYTASRISKGGGFTRTLECTQCETLKTQTLSEQGYILKTEYTYPEGYTRPKGAGRITSEENASMRIMSLTERVEGRKGGKRRA